MKIQSIILMIFMTACVSHALTVSEEKETTVPITNISENSYNIKTNFQIGEKHSVIKLEGTNVIENSGVGVFEYIPDDRYQKSDPFRYTEVSFFIAIPFIYTYSTLSVFLFNSFESLTVADRNRTAYKSLKTSELLFTLLGSSVCAAGIAYANYQRIYGKQESKVNMTLIPYMDFNNNRTDSGFMFSFSYPYK